MSLPVEQITSSIPRLRELIGEWRKGRSAMPATEPAEATGNSTDAGSLKFRQTAREGKDVIVAFRSRPVIPIDAVKFGPTVLAGKDVNEDPGLADAIFCEAISVAQSDPGKIIVHAPGKKWNGLTVNHKAFESDVAFGPKASSEELYRQTVMKHDMVSLVLGGGVACVLAYGQTGTGKTYTMTSLEQMLVHELFQKVSDPAGGTGIYDISVSFVEIIGKSVYDLAADDADSDNKPSLMVAEDKLGIASANATVTGVTTEDELQAMIARCLSYRRTSKTARNATSSRSHAIMSIKVKDNTTRTLDSGEFILVDLAGSERHEDRKAHSKQLMDESTENNKSLLALKECVRARARAESEDGFVHIPYRTSRLTWLLKPIFDIENTRLVKTLVIAHVSPHIQDASHSVNTLSYAAPFRIATPRRTPSAYDPEDPRTWDHAATIQWLARAFDDARAARRQASWERQDAEARAQDKRIRPLPPLPADTASLLGFEALCASPHGGRYLSRMYSSEWLEACVGGAELGRRDVKAVTETVKDDAISVYLSLGQMLVRARNRTRTAVMARRRVVEPDVEEPDPLDDLYAIVRNYTDEERSAFWTAFPSEWMEEQTVIRFNAGMGMTDAARTSYSEAIEKFEPTRQAMAEEKRKSWRRTGRESG